MAHAQALAHAVRANDLSLGFAPLPLLHPAVTGHELQLHAADLAFPEPVLARMLQEYQGSHDSRHEKQR